MKNLTFILRNPKAGGQIVLPRHLVRNMFENMERSPEARVCVFLLLNCAYSDGGGSGLHEGEMVLMPRLLSRQTGLPYSRLRRLLCALEAEGIVELVHTSRRRILLRWLNYRETCRMGGGPRKPGGRGRAERVLTPEEEASFDVFWSLYHRLSRQLPRDKYLAQCEWAELTEAERRLAVERMEDYFRSLSSMDYVRTGANYLKCRSFLF